MRQPIAALTHQAVDPAAPNTKPPRRRATAASRSFAELLAEAEAVQDHISVRYPRPSASTRRGGVLQGALAILTRQPAIPGFSWSHRRSRSGGGRPRK